MLAMAVSAVRYRGDRLEHFGVNHRHVLHVELLPKQSQPMKITGPERFKLIFDAKKCTAAFSGVAKNRLPKLYVVVSRGDLIYVGVTKRTMRDRFYSGWNAKGRGGYHGYAFRHTHTEADLYIWCHEDAPKGSSLDLETVEAEVAFLIRSEGQWPCGQTEIHFHPSGPAHRRLAVSVMQHIREAGDRAQVVIAPQA